MPNQPSYRPYIFSTILLGAGGWIGLYFLLTYSLPTYWPRWGFFALLFVAVTGSALPLVFLINRYLLKPLDGKSVVRESLWIGFYVVTLAWLQLGRALNFSLAVWIALGMVLVEALLRPRVPSEPPSAPTPISPTEPDEPAK